jgi:gluconokinase
MIIPGLRSPYVKTGGILYFARMLDKARLHAKGELPADFVGNLGLAFDGFCVNLLWIEYPALVERIKEGGTDEELLEWAYQQGRKPSDEEIMIWNTFMRKRGWNDEVSGRLVSRLKEGGFEDRTDIQTMFDYIDLDEGRDPAKKS